MNATNNTNVPMDAPRQINLPPLAEINYVSKDGQRIRPVELASTLEVIKEDAEYITANAGDNTDLADRAEMLFDLANYITPDLITCPPAPPTEAEIAQAQRIIDNAVSEARILLNTESRRQASAAMRKEAFCIPNSILFEILEAVPAGEGLEERFKAAESVLERHGWTTTSGNNPAHIAKQGESLRLFREMLEDHPRHHLTAQALQVLKSVLEWQRAKKRPSEEEPLPCVPYPFVQMDLLPYASIAYLPAEYRNRHTLLPQNIEEAGNGPQ